MSSALEHNAVRELGRAVDPSMFTPFEREWVRRVLSSSGLPFGCLMWLDEGVCSVYVDPQDCYGSVQYMKVYRFFRASGDMDEVTMHTEKSLERWRNAAAE